MEEYQNGTDPYTYDLDALDYFVGFLEGFCFGDAAESNNAAVVFGQITSGFVPIWADSRDVAANLENGEWGYSLISAVGLVPLAGDAAKIAGTVADFIKHSDNIPEIIKVIDKVGETIPGIAKHLPSSAFDKIVDLLKNGQPISKAEYTKLKEVFAASGKNLDELLSTTFKNANEINYKPQNLLDELASSGKKYNPNEVEFVLKNPNGEIMWLEKGNASRGLEHILLRHENDFAKRGINDVKSFLYNTLEQTPVKKGTNSKGAYAEYIINGEKYLVAYGYNGYIVSFYPF